MIAWALTGWQKWLPELWLAGRDHCLGVFSFSVSKDLQCCHLPFMSLRLLLLPPPQQGAGIHGRSPPFLSKLKGPWLYGDGEAYTEYVQNDFYKQSWKTPVWCRVLLARAIERKLRFSFAFRKQLSFLAWGLKKEGAGSPPPSLPPPPFPSHSFFMDICWGCIRSWKALLHHPTLRLVPTEMNEERCSGYSRSREQWGTSETNPLGTLKQIKNQHRFSPGNYRLLI